MSGTNAPRYRLTCNGQPLLGVKKLQVSPPFAYQGGTFSFVKVFVPSDTFPASFWADTTTKAIQIGIEISDNTPNGYAQIMTGNVDTYGYDFGRQAVTVNGRDLSALMIDTLIVQTYKNLTASEIASAIAQEHGLSAKVTETGTIVGQYYDIDHDQQQGGVFSRAVNEWDLLCLLGNKEGIVPYVLGSTLYFNPFPSPPTYFDITCAIDGNGNPVSTAEDLKFARNLTTARDVKVTVKSWNARQKRLITSAAYTKTIKQPKTGVTSQPVPFTFEHDNLTQQQADALARQIALDISTHERVMNCKLPGTSGIGPQTVLRVKGTGDDWSQIYYPQSAPVTLDFAGGYATTVAAKFSSPLGLYDSASNAAVGSSADGVTDDS